MENPFGVCLPEHLHPYSQLILEQWIDGRITILDFMRWFHMPNSSYLAVTDCIFGLLGLPPVSS